MFKFNLQQLLLLHFCISTVCLNVALACHGELLATGITEQEKQIILQEHNRLRQQVATGRYPGQPGAENMREIVWDNELAERAQKWAENCQFRHDPHRTLNRFTMGQNLAIIWSTAPLDPNDGDFPSRIQNWFNEVQKYSYGDAWSPKTGHYSQLVWGETNLIGCGFAEYKDASKYNKLYVCNYGPGGNVVGYNPYQVGRPSCSVYGLKQSTRYQGLCADDNLPAYDDNVIETYDYKTTNPFNIPNLTKTTTFIAPNTNTFYQTFSSLINNNNNNNNNHPQNALSSPYNRQAASVSSSSFYKSPALSSLSSQFQPSSSSSISTSYHHQQHSTKQKIQRTTTSKKSNGQYSFSTQTKTNIQTGYNSSNNNNNNDNNNGKYRYKYENYKQSGAAEEYQKSVFKPTSLLAPSTAVEQKRPTYQQTTKSPTKSGWSLYNWTG
ncbi:CRISP/Allergen/PR-1 [Glossina fuscipes]|uniref:CRISP/Allergen/PR-1 n=1 Tax=Glossina fuscipes TaxID=7396 RepID=A0A9C6DTM3_9MUSC|nr:CRISP/Allergen/PR-1 [Glossina fuscipes]